MTNNRHADRSTRDDRKAGINDSSLWLVTSTELLGYLLLSVQLVNALCMLIQLMQGKHDSCEQH